MSVVNEPKYKNGLLAAIRDQLEHRALWMYLLCDEAAKKGLPPEEYAPAAIRRCGLYQGDNLRQKAGGGDSLKGLKKTLFSKPAQLVFEMKILRCDDDHLDIDFHYCPLVKAWQIRAAAMKKFSACAIMPCVATAVLRKVLAVHWNCRKPLQKAMGYARFALSENNRLLYKENAVRK